MNSPVFLSKKSISQLLGVSLRTIENLIAAGELPVRRVGRRVLIPRQALEEFTRRDHTTVKKAVTGGAR